MLPRDLWETLSRQIAEADHSRETIIDVMYALQDHYGYMTDEALQEAAALLELTPLEVEEMATFYEFIYREPVGNMSFMSATASSAGCRIISRSWIICLQLGTNWEKPPRTDCSPCFRCAASATAIGLRP